MYFEIKKSILANQFMIQLVYFFITKNTIDKMENNIFFLEENKIKKIKIIATINYA